jgi:hypothetical protein
VAKVLAAAGIRNGNQVYDRLAGSVRGELGALLEAGLSDVNLAARLQALALAHQVELKLTVTSPSA